VLLALSRLLARFKLPTSEFTELWSQMSKEQGVD